MDLAGDGVGLFAGELSLESGGGLASVRRGDQVGALSAYDALESLHPTRSASDFGRGAPHRAAMQSDAGGRQASQAALISIEPT